MKVKVTIVILIVISLLLGVALVYRHSTAVNQQKTDQGTITELSQEIVQAKSNLDEQKKVNSVLETNLALRIEEVVTFSNNLVAASNSLAKAQALAQAAAEAARAELILRDQKIAKLETERDELDKQLLGLTSSLTTLRVQITDTERKLAASEGDREFLIKELRRLQTEKAGLEKQFNDLSVVRAQVSKLKDDLSVARRIEWIRQGLYSDKKGGELLQSGFAGAAGTPRTNYNLNVEIRQDGGVNVLPPATNVPTKR